MSFSKSGSASCSRFFAYGMGTSTPETRRSEEHTSELQSQSNFVCRLLLEKKSRHGRALRAMVVPTERPVLLPALLLAGARLDFRATAALPWIAAAAIGARIVCKIVTGWMLAAVSAPARKGGPWVGLSLLSSGALAMSIGLA